MEEKEDDLKDLKSEEDKTKDGKFSMTNQRFMLTYKTHLNKDEFCEWWNEKYPKTKEIYIAHETGDKHHNYLHTHIVIDAGQTIRTKNCRIFDYLDIHPQIRFISNSLHWKRACKYIAKEDKDLAFLNDMFKSIANRVWEKKNIEEVAQMANNPNDIVGLLTLYNLKPNPYNVKSLLTDLYPWQQFVHDKIINEEPHLRNFVWLWDNDIFGNSGKTQFTRHMIITYPKDIYAIAGCPNLRDFSTILANALQSGWNQKCLIFLISKSDSVKKEFYSVLEKAKDGIISPTKYMGCTLVYNIPHVIILSNYPPNVKRLTKRLDLYHIKKDKECEEVDPDDVKEEDTFIKWDNEKAPYEQIYDKVRKYK